jgi:pyruvate kinase
MITANNQLFLTKIIATLGPASESATTVRQLIHEGVRVFRINFSHGTFNDYERMYNTVRSASEALDIPIAVIGDLSGPKIRVGKVEDGGVDLKRGSTVEFCKTDHFTIRHESSDLVRFSTTYPNFIDEVKIGERILLDDGNVLLKCLERVGSGNDELLVCVVIDGGLITSSKGVNLPDTDLSVPALTEKDYRCVEFAVKMGFDYLALSFVRQASDIIQLKEKLFELGARDKINEELYGGNVQTEVLGGDYENFIPIISKIEKPQAIDNLEEILQQTDGIMVARGDLGVEMDLAEVAIHQKRIINMCHDWGVPVIVATQMLQSMIESPVPTRAEVSDVANAIFDGADAVMLSGETAVGKWPVETVRMMNRIAVKTNNWLLSKDVEVAALGKLRSAGYRNAALAHGVQTIVKDIETKYIAIWSKLGGGAVFLSQYRIPKPIIAFSESKRILQQMALLYGLVPVYMEQPASGSQFIRDVDNILQERGFASRGDGIIFAMGEPIDRVGITNRLVIHFVGELE